MAQHGAALAGLPALDAGEGAFGPGAVAGAAVHRDLVGERDDDAHTELLVVGIVAVEGPDHRGSDVVDVHSEPRADRELVRSDQLGCPVVGEVGEVDGVAAAPEVGLGSFGELLQRVRAQRLEQVVAGVAGGGLVDRDHRLRDQRTERVEYVPRLDPVAGHDRGRSARVEPAGEHSEAVEHDLLGRFSSRRSTTTR